MVAAVAEASSEGRTAATWSAPSATACAAATIRSVLSRMTPARASKLPTDRDAVAERRLGGRDGVQDLGSTGFELVDPLGKARFGVGQRPGGLSDRVQVVERAQDEPGGDVDAEHGDGHVTLRREMATAASSEPTPQRLAAIRDQLTLLADYL
jgi:hypothetical protein